MRDNTLVICMIILFLLVLGAVCTLDEKIDAANKTIDYILKYDQLQNDRITNLNQHQSNQDNRLDKIERMDVVQNNRLNNHYNQVTGHAQRFGDLLHEVNAFEEAIESLATVQIQLPTTWTGSRLGRSNGVCYGPSGRETYYNMDMSFCIQRMRSRGYSEKDYPYWIRNDGCKMLGPYIMVATNFKIRPLGTLVETSLGWGIAVDTGGFTRQYPRGIDVATNW